MTLIEKINSLTWYNNLAKLKEVLKEVSTSGGSGSGIVDAPAIAGTGTTVMTFDEIRYHGLTNQTGNIVLELNATPNINKNGRVQVLDINGTPPYTLSHLANSVNSNGVSFDNTKNNVIYYDFVNGKLKYNIILQNLPDVIAPLLVSATVQNASPSNIVLTYSEPLTVSPLPAFSDFVLNLSKTVTGILITGNVITLTVNTPYVNGNVPTIGYTSGVNKIKDLAGNIAINLVGQAVTNNINPPAFNSKSISQTTNNILTSVANPTGLSFSTGIGGTDSPFSISYWVYQTINGNSQIISLAHISTPNDYQYVVLHSASSIVLYLRSSPFELMGTYSTAGIPLNVWTNVVITYSGNKLNNGIKIYKNASLQSVASDNNGVYTGGVAVSSDYKLNIAGTSLNSASVYNKGLLDEISVINKELTQTEVTELYNGGTPVNLLTSSFAINVKSYFRFEDNLNDSGTNGYNLSPAGTTVYSTNKP